MVYLMNVFSLEKHPPTIINLYIYKLIFLFFYFINITKISVMII